MRRDFLATILCFQLFVFSVTAFAQNAEWRIISSTVNFKIKNAGFSVNGKFGPVKGKINFDRTSLTGNFIDVTIDAGLIDTDNKTRDKHLKKEDYFFPCCAHLIYRCVCVYVWVYIRTCLTRVES